MLGLCCGVAVAQAAPAAGTPAQAKEAEAKPSDPAAAKMVFQAALLLRRANLDEAQKQLDQAKALNDQELRLWSTYAVLHAARGDKATAIEDDKKELALHPDAIEVYVALATLQDQLGKRADEEVTLRALIKIESHSPSGAARLVKMLVEDGKAADAVALGQDYVTRFDAVVAAEPRINPRGGDGLKLELSRAQLAAGMKAESLATMVALLKVTNSPVILNDGAYRLADESMELPLAEKSARRALGLAEFNSRRLTLDTKPELTRLVILQVAGIWDTVGWTLFREGKLDEAESYVRSAWLQKQTVTLGQHLAEIEMARGDKNKALLACDLSLAEAAQKPVEAPRAVEAKAADAKSDDAKTAEAKADEAKLSAEMQAVADSQSAESAKTDAAELAKLQQTADGLRKSGAVSKGPAGLKEMLTFPMASLPGVSGSGEFVAMLQFGIIQTATGTSKTNATGMLTRMLAAKVGTGLWPPGSGARLVMKAQVNCSKGGCVAVFADF
jgi:tetratricopeptide (TPR) repeat protein